MRDVDGIIRIIIGFSKVPDEDGDQLMAVKYKLKPLKLSFLQKLFDIDPNDSDPCVKNVIYCYDINEEQAQALQPYVIDGIIDLKKYDFMLSCVGEK
jgi:hypothetical protein